MFETGEEAQAAFESFDSEDQPHVHLMYDDNEVLYLIYWPLIQIDSVCSGREIDSPFEMHVPYAVPKPTTRSVRHGETDRPSPTAPQDVEDGA
jgi:hypothetical protein